MLGSNQSRIISVESAVQLYQNETNLVFFVLTTQHEIEISSAKRLQNSAYDASQLLYAHFL